MFEAVFTDVPQELLQAGNFNHPGPAEGFERIVGEGPAAGIATDFAARVVRREAREAHGAGFYLANAGAEGVLLTDGAGDDGLEVHFHVTEEMLWKIAAVEAHRLVGIGAVVVVPIQQRTGSFRS